MLSRMEGRSLSRGVLVVFECMYVLSLSRGFYREGLARRDGRHEGRLTSM